MKTMILILLIPLNLFAPDIIIMQNIDTYKMWQRDRVIHAIIMVESRYNPTAYNKKESAVGIMQIRPIMLKHINNISGSNYTLNDRYDSLKSIAMFDTLMKYRNPEYDLQLCCNLWNAGNLNPKGKVKIKVEKYYKKALLYYK